MPSMSAIVTVIFAFLVISTFACLLRNNALEYLTTLTYYEGILFHISDLSLQPKQHQQRNKRNKCQQCRQVDQAIKAPDLRKYSTQAAAQQLPQSKKTE